MNICEFSWNPGKWPYGKRCQNHADVRVRIYFGDDNAIEEIDLCHIHKGMAAREFLGDLTTIKTYYHTP